MQYAHVCAHIHQRCARLRNVRWVQQTQALRVFYGYRYDRTAANSSRSASQTHLNDVIVLELLKKLDLSQRRKVRPLRVLPQLHGDLLDSHDAPGRFLRLKRS